MNLRHTATHAAVTAALVAAVALAACTHTVYIPAENIHTESREREVQRLVHDTVRESRLVWVHGDTVVAVRDRERIQRLEVRDTCYIARRDTIRTPYPVERPLTRWQQAKMDLGGIALGTLAAVLAAAVLWLIKKFRK